MRFRHAVLPVANSLLLACGPIECRDIAVGATLKSLPIKGKDPRPYDPFNWIDGRWGPVDDVLCCSKLNYCPGASCRAPIPTTCNVDCTTSLFRDGDAYLLDNYTPQAGEYCHVWVSNDRVVASWQVRD